VKPCANSRLIVPHEKFPMVPRTLFCRHCNISEWNSATNSEAAQVEIITDLMSALSGSI
jgi:hypothetical protein